MRTEPIIFKDLGMIQYKLAWDYQEELVNANLRIKTELRQNSEKRRQLLEQSTSRESAWANGQDMAAGQQDIDGCLPPATTHHLLFCEHPAVYTLGKSGHMENVLLSMTEMNNQEIEFFKTNRGGDITFHGPQQLVGYPVLDLEKFDTDIGKYLRNLEEVIIKTMAEYGIRGGRSTGETGVWIDPDVKGRERKICAMGIRCSRWVTMHGFALNVNTDLSYFNHIIPCGIVNKQVTSIEKELGYAVDFEEVKQKLKKHFEIVFGAHLIQ